MVATRPYAQHSGSFVDLGRCGDLRDRCERRRGRHVGGNQLPARWPNRVNPGRSQCRDSHLPALNRRTQRADCRRMTLALVVHFPRYPPTVAPDNSSIHFRAFFDLLW